MFGESIEKLNLEREKAMRLEKESDRFQRLAKSYDNAYNDENAKCQSMNKEVKCLKGEMLDECNQSELKQLRGVLMESTNRVVDELINRSEAENARNKELVEQHAECSICRLVPDQRVAFECGHTCCRTCAQHVCNVRPSAKCHLCRAPINRGTLRVLY